MDMVEKLSENEGQETSERRPLATRSKRWAIYLAQVLSSSVTPNQISVLGMLAGIAAGVCLAATNYEPFTVWGFLLGAAFIQFRLLCNMLDGMVAVNRQECSSLGELYNEIPDRVSDTAILVGAGYAVSGHIAFGFWAALAAMFLAYVRAMGKNAGAHQEFCGPMGKPHRMFTMTVVSLYAGLVPASYQPGIPGTEQPATITYGLIIILVGCLPTLFRRLNRIVRALNQVENQGAEHG